MKLILIAMALFLMGAQEKPSAQVFPSDIKARAEHQVANQFESIRKSAGLSALKRVQASVVEIQLACTAATSGKDVRDPRFGGLDTYVTDDLSSESETLKSLALTSGRGWSRYSVVVNLDVSSKPEAVRYRVAIEVRSSWIAEFLAPITYDNPIKNSRDWKDQVTPLCRKITR